MANTDSFIEEVSEEVRRDRLFGLFRKWGWLAILIVLAIVGGAAYIEWRSAQDRGRAEAFGNALMAALEPNEPEGRIAALAEIRTPTPEAQIILALLAASEASTADSPAEAAAQLRAAAEAPGLARRYVDLALLKAQMLDPAPEAEARIVLEALAEPGAPYSALAEEQLALMEIRAGDLEDGLDRLRAIERSAAATAGLQQRAAQLIVALESGAVLADAPTDVPGEDAAAIPAGDAGGAEQGAAEDDTGGAAEEDPDPSGEAPAEEGAGADEAPAEEGAGADDAPAEGAPAEGAPAEDAPAEGAPATEVPAEDVPAAEPDDPAADEAATDE